MKASLIIATVILSLLLVLTAMRKISHRHEVVESYARVGVPEQALNPLAGVLIFAAAGLLSGLWWPGIGLLTAVGVAGYFVVAIVFHVRAGDHQNLITPMVYEAIAITIVVLYRLDGM